MRTNGLAREPCNDHPVMPEVTASRKSIGQPLQRNPLRAPSRQEAHGCSPSSQPKAPQ
uniref:Uncharacterized protein n=1 Tax=Arundo donax TaxID=35708 RepID=A0A0A9DBQ6_ARUDO